MTTLSGARIAPLALSCLLCLAAVLWPAIAAAQAGAAAAAANDALLARERWREQAFGVSMLPPRGARIIQQAADGSLVKFVDPGRYTISVNVRETSKGVELETIKQQTTVEVFHGAGKGAEGLEDRDLRIAGRPGNLMFFMVHPEEKLQGRREPMYFGQAVMLLDPFTVFVMSIEGPEPVYPQAKRIFEAVIGSVEVMDPAELDRIRDAWVQQGQRWRRGLDRQMLRTAMVNEQWLRVLEGETDIGYMRIQQSIDSMLGVPGIKVTVGSRVVSAGDAIDTESFFFISDDGRTEVWSTRRARRTLRQNLQGNRQGPQGPQIFEETGLRSTHDGELNTITVRRVAPGNIDNLEWATPPEYVGQAELYLLPRLLPRDEQLDMAFYAYNPDQGALTLRTLQVFPIDTGYVVRERPSPNSGEIVSTYDTSGNLIQRQAGSRMLVPATVEQMRKIWDIE